jgi:predicted helicase
MRAEGIDSAAGKQKIVVELYDKFFRNAFPKMTERLGIVYTPVEVVDFIIHSVNHILQTEFGQTLGSKGVHIIDPFTGTGTFITRLLQSGLIKPRASCPQVQARDPRQRNRAAGLLHRRHQHRGGLSRLVGGKYQPFEGICLTDTFQMYEKDDLVIALLVDNSARRKRQKALDIRVIVGNPPYSNCASIFSVYSGGIKTNRDWWCFNSSHETVSRNMERMISFYNSEVDRYVAAGSATPLDASEFINTDPTKISWTREVKQDLERRKKRSFVQDCVVRATYRPFQKQWLYFNRHFNNCVYQMPKIFPNLSCENRVITMGGGGAGPESPPIIVDQILSLQPNHSTQCFPLYVYEKTAEVAGDDLFSISPFSVGTYTRRDAITDAGLAHFQAAYPAPGEGDTITKEDLFYYIYGLLHSPDYRSRYADNLGKELPRIPAVKAFADFRAFSQAGRDLAHWHLNYETVACYEGATVDYGSAGTSTRAGMPALQDYRVVKMKFAKTRDPETNKSVNDKTTVIYNERLTIRHIPLEAYDYVVNGKPALEWVMERQSVTTDKASGITNDANLWATETMGDAKYPLELFLRVITVSLETMKIVRGLPGLEI